MNLSVNNINSYIFGRNEGKIKSYASCTDLRAWSHDGKIRDRYLRDWIRCDMPVYIISVRTLITLLKIMTIKTNGQLVSRCHPNCKSKIVLDSICTSCHVIKECLKSNQNVQDFFVKEEFETGHWPCDKCLEVLKTIKMFWKIIVDKLFHIETSTNNDTELPLSNPTTYIRVENIRSLTRTWQKDIIDDVLLVKKIIPFTKNTFSKDKKLHQTDDHVINETTVFNKSQQFNVNKDCNKYITNVGRKKTRRKLNKSTSVNLQFVDVACDAPDFMGDNNNVLESTKVYNENVQNKCHSHINEIDKLRAENDSLKIELRNIYETHPWKYALYNKNHSDFDSDDQYLMPKPFDDGLNDKHSVNNLESEMVITMKNCCHKSFKHVSVLKVLHKTNNTNSDGLDEDSSKKESPLRFLARVQTTFGEIVKREMSFVNDKHSVVTSEFETAYRNVHASKSAPSCSTMSTRSSLISNYVSVKDLNMIVQ